MSQMTDEGDDDVSVQNTPCYGYDNEIKGDQGLETSFQEDDSYSVILSSDLGSTVASSNDKRVCFMFIHDFFNTSLLACT